MNKMYTRFLEECKFIDSYYKNLVDLTKNHNYVGFTNEWIIDNYYLVVESKNTLKKIFRDNKKMRKNLIVNESVYDVLLKIFDKYKYNLDKSVLIKELNDYQAKNNCYFPYTSIEAIPVFIPILLIDKLYNLCVKKDCDSVDVFKVKDIMKQIDNDKDNGAVINLDDYIDINDYMLSHPLYLYYLNVNLKELGEISTPFYDKLNDFLAKNNVSLKDVINNQHIQSINDNILASSIFNNLRNLSRLEVSELCDKVSKTEKLLLTDTVYKNMTQDTKILYRHQIVENTKKTDEYAYVCNIVKKCKSNSKGIADYIFKKKNTKLMFRVYLTLIIIFTLLLCFLISPLIFDYSWVAFILLLVPISEVVIQILNKIFMKLNSPKRLPKLDFSKGIPKEYSTMVVIPTIIKDTKKIDSVFENLEKYYLSNKSPNLYFTLLADCMEYNKKEYELDEIIAEKGLKKANELNKKYGKGMFFFVYRRRAYNEKEGKFLGYERKRGGLLHFNELLLGTLSKENKEKYIYCESVSNLKVKIKYVITLDVDTELVLNSAQELVGLMAHPYNKPVLNESKTKVIDGYALVQPRVSVDIESTNKTVYSQLMAGIGGFDIYSSIVPNFYQDVFDEGSFVGKGIYDLEVFETVVGNKLPENLILSHDLLEGNYVRCGYASDIELVDDFPGEFLVDMSRQHRWTRGDVQILGWLKNKVRNNNGQKVKNPLNGVEKFKIFDNLRRIFIEPSMLLLLVLSFLLGNPVFTFIAIVLMVCLPIVFYLREIFNIQKRTIASFKHYDTLVFGTSALITRLYINLITIPYIAWMRINAMFKSLYRMFISHKNLLNWITAEDAAKTINSKLSTYFKAFKANYIVTIVMFVLCFVDTRDYIILLIISLCFLTAPLVLWFVSKKNEMNAARLESQQDTELLDVAYRTWTYFKTLLNEENHYLIPDNYQVNREIKEDTKTSPTDIGMSITSIISACELEFISREDAIQLLSNIVTTIGSLEKWNGMIYNWYNIKTLKKMIPFDISSVDNGNLAACLIVAKEFAYKNGSNELGDRISSLLNNMDFTTLYNDQKDVFSVCYNTAEEQLSIYNYNKFASESRILSFVAIAKGDAPLKHWLCLDKSLTKYRKYKGLASWSGTSFEYFMPAIFMKSYPNTLLDESYFFSYYCQKEYMKEVDPNMPWGISESAYGELDDGLNYKYKAFATPYLKVHEDNNRKVVIAPYASILAISTNPEEVYNNVKKIKDIGLYGDFGFFESYDYDDKEIVLSYFAHHQGMILASLANYLKGDIIRSYFHSDIRVKAIEILLKEKIQFNPIIDFKIYGYKKYNYEKEIVENDIREINYLSEIPEVSVLSNNDYLMLINDRGNGFSRYKKVQLNRYRKITEQDYGNFMYIKDMESGKYWSNTYAPTNVKPDKYNIVFASDRINFVRQDNDIATKTEIIVTKEHNAEVRKVTFKNLSNQDRFLEVTTYTEPIIIENIEDITHRTFKSLFISSEYDEEHKCVVMCRKNNNKQSYQYLVNKLFVEDEDSDITFETERVNFIGRNRNTDCPIAMQKSKLSNFSGINVDPIISLRTSIAVPKNDQKIVYFVSGYSKSRDQIDSIVEAYDSKVKVKAAFEYATFANNVNTKILGISGPDMRRYNIMLNYLYQTSRHFINPERKDILTKNSMNQTNLWKYGITGDLPIILVEIDDSKSLSLVKEVIKAYEFYKSRAIFVDIVIINREDDKYKNIINRCIEKERYRMDITHSFMNTPGSIYVLDDNNVNEAESILLNMVARLRFDTRRCASLEESIELLQKENQMVSYEPVCNEKSIDDNYDTSKLLFFNEYGGFTKDGQEYVITNPDTPTPWSNVISNDKFGTIVTNNECGFTYAYNSQMFKITSWTNDIVLNDKSEGIEVNGKQVNATTCIHGFGYSKFLHNTPDYLMETTHFVSLKDTVKFYKVKFTNRSHTNNKYRLCYWINPTFGPNEEKSSRYLLSDYYKDMNSILIRNVYNTNFSHITAFMSSTLDINSYLIDKILYKAIYVDIEVNAGETKEFSFMLGTEIGNENVHSLIKKFNTNDKINNEFDKVVEYWKNKLGVYKVKTPDNAFNVIINGWYLYQTMSSRLNAKAGFYQVGGAFGYRDQLQDATNLCIVDEENTKNQILTNAKHQFEQGDVLHWWHELIYMGLRSRYKDDFLWLVYSVNRYIIISGDYKILDEKVPYVCGQELAANEEERGINYSYSSDEHTIYEHCLASIKKSMNEIGSNGLPLMGGGDWNDGMNKIGVEGKGTSVWLGFFLYLVLKDFKEIIKKYKKADITKYDEFLSNLKISLNENAWDGDYYLRAFFDNGTPLGSRWNAECKIDLISQSFSILSEVCPQERIQSVIKSVEDLLVDKDLRIVKLLTPAFVKSKNNPGYIMDYPDGIRENGGQYTHSVAWYIMALIKLGYNNRAYSYYQMINPINRALDKKLVKEYRVEPYVIAADIYSNEDNPARGGWTWYTGSAGWFYNVGITEILGLKKEGNTLRFEPCIPDSWDSFEVEYKYKDTLYKIKVNLSNKNSIVVDGDKITKDFITLKNDSRIHAIVVNVRRDKQ